MDNVLGKVGSFIQSKLNDFRNAVLPPSQPFHSPIPQAPQPSFGQQFNNAVFNTQNPNSLNSMMGSALTNVGQFANQTILKPSIPLVQQGLQSAGRIMFPGITNLTQQTNNLYNQYQNRIPTPLQPMAAKLASQQQGSYFNKPMSVEDLGNIAGGIGAADVPGNIFGGVVGMGMQGVQNVIGGKPLTQNMGDAYNQGYQFTAKLGPISAFAKPALSPLIEKIAPVGLEGAGGILRRTAARAVEGGVPMGLYGSFIPSKTLQENIQNTLSYMGQGALFSAVPGLVKEGLAKVSGGKIPEVVSPEQAQQVREYVRNKLGQFAKQAEERGQTYSEYRASQGMSPYGEADAGIKVPPRPIKELKVPSDTPIKDLPLPGGEDTSPTNSYLSDLIKKQDEARQGEKLGIKTTLSNYYNKLKEQLINAQAPIEDVLTSSEKSGNFKVLPKSDIRLQIDRSLRSPQLAGQFLKDGGLADTIQKAPDLNALDQYMIAKHSATVEKGGIETGRDLAKDQQLIKDLGPIYEPFAKQVNQYSRKLLQYAVDSGLVSKDMASSLIKKYPEYVPLNRIFNEDELLTQTGQRTGKGVASLSKQTVVQKLQGSERQIESPIASLVEKTKIAFDQGERNKAAQMLATYKDLPDNPFNIKPVAQGEASGKTTFSALINGKKQIFETTPEVAAAAKSLNKEQMGLLAKIVSIPTRILRLGATGLNYPFAVANLIKDQSTAFINSERSLSTSNLVAFMKGLFAALGHGDLYEQMVRGAGGGTSFDIGREAPRLTVSEIRGEGSIGGRLLGVIKNPIRTAEDLIGRTEELTRAQQYHGTYDALIKQGRTPQDAALLAGKAARENTVNFARGGSFSRVLNWVIPYFNAGVQGSRTFVRNVTTRPVQTLTKFAIGVGMPVAAATIWNLTDPKRKQAYQDIPDFEKQNSIVIVPENPTKNKDGTWNVIKIPLSQEIASLTTLIRRPLEQAYQLNPVKIGEMANALFQTATSLNTQTPTGLVSSLTPQIAKPGVEAITNKNLYTGQDIVPPYMKNLPPDQQIKRNTSGTARLIGKLTNLSPLVVQNEAQTMLGGLGPQLLNASDTALNKAGVIPDNQVGGRGLGTALQKRFFLAQGGETMKDAEAQLKSGISPKDTQAYDLLHTPKQIDANGNPIQDNTVFNSQEKAIIYLNRPDLQEIDAAKAKLQPNHDPIWDLPPGVRNIVFASQVQLPGQKNTYDDYLYQQPWYKAFQKARSDYYDSIKNTGTTQSNTAPYPQPSAYVQTQMDNKNWSDPQVKAYLDATTAYKNNQLQLAGLPPIPPYVAKGSLYPSSSMMRNIRYSNRKIRQLTMKKPRKFSMKGLKKRLSYKALRAPTVKKLQAFKPKAPRLRALV